MRTQYAARMPVAVARAVSILGHPLPLLALALTMLPGAGGGAQRLRFALGFAAFATLVMGYSWWQVRRRRWAHVDASGQHERGHLNRFLVPTLLLGAALAWRSAAAPELVLALALAAVPAMLAMLSARWCKLSLHLAFALFAACLLARTAYWAAALMLAFALPLGWSRLALARHVPRDLLAGALAGMAAGALFLSLAVRLRG